MLASDIISMMDQINMYKSSPYQIDQPKPHDPTTVVPSNRSTPPLYGGYSTKIGGMWNLNHDISSPKLYYLIINTKLKGDTYINLKTFTDTSRCSLM